MTTRTTHRSTKGKKLYAVRDKKGRIKDIQTFKRAHGQDVKRRAKDERIVADGPMAQMIDSMADALLSQYAKNGRVFVETPKYNLLVNREGDSLTLAYRRKP